MPPTHAHALPYEYLSVYLPTLLSLGAYLVHFICLSIHLARSIYVATCLARLSYGLFWWVY